MADDSRARLKAQRENWMRQREIDQDRQQMVAAAETQANSASTSTNASTSASTSGSTTSSTNVGSVHTDLQLLAKLAEKMTETIKKDIRAEVMEEARASGSDTQATMDALQSHTCPVCMSIMNAKAQAEDKIDHSPMLLFPCGHTLCTLCVNEYMKKMGRQTCPYCRSKIERCAINRPLLEMITSLRPDNVERFCEQRTCPGKANVLDDVQPSYDSVRYSAPRTYGHTARACGG